MIKIQVCNSKGDVVATYTLDQIEEAKQHDRLMEAVDELLPIVSKLPSIANLDLTETQIEDLCLDLLRNQDEIIPALEKGKPTRKRGRRAGSSSGPDGENENDTDKDPQNGTPGNQEMHELDGSKGGTAA